MKRRIIAAFAAVVLSLGVAAPLAYADPAFGPGNGGGGQGNSGPQRCCGLCGGSFEVERRRAGQRKYCPRCSPPGRQVVRLPYRTKLRRRPPVTSAGVVLVRSGLRVILV